MKEAFLFVEGSDAAPVRLWRADRFVERLRGLLGRPALADDRGLWIAPCGSVHTFGMRFTIDVVFIDRAGRVVQLAERLASGRMASAKKAASVVELAQGAIARLGLRPGQQLSWSGSIDGVRVPLASASLLGRLFGGAR